MRRIPHAGGDCVMFWGNGFNVALWFAKRVWAFPESHFAFG